MLGERGSIKLMQISGTMFDDCNYVMHIIFFMAFVVVVCPSYVKAIFDFLCTP